MPGPIPLSGSLPRWSDRTWPRDDGASAKLRAAIQRFPANRRLPRTGSQWRLADWIAGDVQPYPSDPKSTGEPKGRLDPDAHAHAVIRALESRCEALGVDPCFASRRGHAGVPSIAVGRGAEQRKAGRLDDARWTAACLSAFAKMLARRDPNEAAFHLLLCEAFEQESKNAWKVKRLPRRSKTATRKATGATACVPRYVSTPGTRTRALKVAGLQDKLVGLASERPSSQSARDSRELRVHPRL